VWAALAQGAARAAPDVLVGETDPQAKSKVAHAETAPSAGELARLGDQLGSDDPATREQAQAELRALGDDALPAIRVRLSSLAEHSDGPRVIDAVSAFRRVQGVTALDGEVDLERGIAPMLASDRSRGMREGAELVLLLRALEAQKSPAAAEVIVGKLFPVEPKAFRYEARRSLARLGMVALPALVRHQNHARGFIRDLCRETLVALRMDTPGRAVQQDDVVLLSALLEAYGDILLFDAMPVVVSYVADERAAVREAAQKATRRFGKNAIWQLRERYLNATGSEANPAWSAERVLQEITLLHDAPKQRAFADGLLEAEKALASRDLNAAAIALDRSLNQQLAREVIGTAGPLYGRLAALYFESGQLPYALVAYRRALRLSPTDANKDAWQARVRFAEAELRRARGMLDLTGYREALTLDPTFSEAEDALDEASGERAARERLAQRSAGFAAALLLIFAGLSMFRAARTRAADALAASPVRAVASDEGTPAG
jgi:hypothetical protein